MKNSKITARHICVCLCAAVVAAVACGCSGNTYSKQIRQEKKLIDSYIARHNINVIYEEPKLSHGQKWGENDFLAVEGYDDLYFHLSSPIDTTAELLPNGTRVNLRYRKYGLDVYTDTVSCWNTDDQGDPVQLSVGTVDNNSCTAWHVALRKMGRSGAECKIICPSTVGFMEDNASVTPYCYEMKVTKRK